MSSRVTWSASALWPLWMVQIIVFIAAIIALGLTINLLKKTEALSSNNPTYISFHADYTGASTGLVAGGLAYFSICVLLVIIEIALYIRQILGVWTYFTFQLFRAIVWTFVSVTCLIGVSALVRAKSNSGWAVFYIIWIAIASIATYYALGYSCIQVHRHRRMGRAPQPDKMQSHSDV